MSLQRQILIWAAVLAALLYALYLLGSIVAPFAAGLALGYLLDPVVVRLERLGLNRLAASLLILAIFVAVLDYPGYAYFLLAIGTVCLVGGIVFGIVAQRKVKVISS